MSRLLVFSLAAGMLTSGCGLGGRTNYYLLTPAGQEQRAAASAHSKSVGVWRPNLPEYLERNEIVQRRAGHEISFSAANRWAEPLADTAAAALAANLASTCPDVIVTQLPTPVKKELDVQLFPTVNAFERVGDGVVLKVQTEVKAGAATRHSEERIEELCNGSSISETVACMSRALGEYALEVARYPELGCGAE